MSVISDHKAVLKDLKTSQDEQSRNIQETIEMVSRNEVSITWVTFAASEGLM